MDLPLVGDQNRVKNGALYVVYCEGEDETKHKDL